MKNTYILGNDFLVDTDLMLEPNLLAILEDALLEVQGRLQAFANTPEFAQQIELAFGEGVNAEALRVAWQAGDFSQLPRIEIRSAAELSGANGAFARATNTIYLAWEYLTQNFENSEAIARVLLEEIGHYVDSKINAVDAKGDEGAIFSALGGEQELSQTQLQQLTPPANDQEFQAQSLNVSSNMATGSLLDLTLISATAPAIANVYKTIPISWTGARRNKSFGFLDSVYLSRDSVLDKSDIVLLSEYIVPSTETILDESYSISKNLTIPSSLNFVSGKYNLLFVTDHNGSVTELSETNNIRVVPIELQANLPLVSINNVAVIEGDVATFAVRLEEPLDVPVNVKVNLAPGTTNLVYGNDNKDYIYRPNYFTYITFQAGETVKSFSVETIDDSISEDTEEFLVEISKNNQTLAQGIGSIHDNDISTSSLSITSVNYPAGTPENPTVFHVDSSSYYNPQYIEIGFSYNNNTGSPVFIFSASNGGNLSNGSPYYDFDNDPKTNIGLRPKSGQSGQTTQYNKVARTTPGEITALSVFMQQTNLNGSYGAIVKEVTIPVNYLFIGDVDLSVTKSTISNPVKVGQEFTYEITINNNTQAFGFNADNVILTETLPRGLHFVRASGASIQGVETTEDTTQVKLYDIGSIGSGQAKTVKITVVPTEEYSPEPDDLSNEWKLKTKTSVISEARYINDPDLTNNTIEGEIIVFDDSTDLAVSIESNKDWIGIGPNHLMTYNFSVINKGTKSATGTQLLITIPKGIKIVDGNFISPNISVDNDGNTIVLIDVGRTLEKNGRFTGDIVVEATGFSQPLDKLRDYLWDIDVRAEVQANESETNTNNNSFTKTVQVDSSKGLAEELVNRFLFGETNQPNMANTFATSQAVARLNADGGDENTDDNQFEQGLSEIFSEFRGDVEMAVIRPVVESYQTANDTVLEVSDAYKQLDPIRGVKAVQTGAKDLNKQFNEAPDNFNRDVKKAGVKALRKSIGLLGDAADLGVFSGMYQSLESIGPEGLSYSRDDGVVYYQKKTSTEQVDFAVTVGKFEEASDAALQSLLANNTAPVKDWVKSTVNNFSGQGLYSKWFPYGQLGLNLGYSKATETTLVNLGASSSFGSPYYFGLGLNGAYKDSEVRPSVLFTVKWLEPKPKNLEPDNHLVSPENHTNNTENSFQSISALADFTFSETANLSQLVQSISNGNDNSVSPFLDESGNFLVFTSEASNLIQGDTNATADVFVRNLQTNTLQRISFGNYGTEANGKSEGFGISADGRYVIFASNASNLIANDTNNVRDIFVRDRQTNTTQRVSLTNEGLESNGASDLAAISADGRYVVFSSIASNLVQGDTNDMVDVFVHDLQTGVTERISVANDGTQSNDDSLSPGTAISADGRYVVFYSYASNLVPNDTNDSADIFVRDRQTGITKRVSTANDGTEANDLSLSPSISADGRYIVFSSLASNLVAGDSNETGDIFVYDQQTGTIERVSLTSDETEADSNSSRPAISADGRYVVFQSRATNLGIENPDFYSNIYLRDRQTGETKLISEASETSADGDSSNPTISGDGSVIAFDSGATKLVEGDTNDAWDVFVYKPTSSETNNAEINGTVWNDVNGDGIKGDNEPTLSNWTVYLDSNKNNILDEGEVSTLSDSQGLYRFDSLPAGTYTVAQVIQDGWQQTYPGVNVTTTASNEIIVIPSDLLDSTGITQGATVTDLLDLSGFWADSRFANIKGQGQSIVIIDTGADLNHPLFGPDTDNNGIADRIIYQYDFADNDNDASDRNNHGSHITSIAAQIAPEANLIVLKVFKDNGSGYFADLEKALQWVNQNSASYNIKSVNLSLGDSQNWTTETGRYGIGDELAAIASQNILIAAAAGNSFYTFNSTPGLAYPAIDPNVISVGAVWADDFGSRTFSNGAVDYATFEDAIASFSQRHPLLDVFAPGILITGANATGGTISMGGTSQATPYISAIATLSQQIAQQYLGRSLTLTEFSTLLDTTSDLIIDGDDENDNVVNTGSSYPRINVLALAEGILTLSNTSQGSNTGNTGNNGTNDPLYIPDNTVSLVHTVTLTAGQILTDINFGNQLLPTNQAPTLINLNKTGDEDTVITFTQLDFTDAFNDADNNDLVNIQILTLPTNGTLQLNGETVSLNQKIAWDNLNNLNFIPDENFNGSVNFSWNGFDGEVYALESANVTVTVNPVNDAPVVQNAIVPQTATQNTAFSFTLPTNTFFDVDAGDSLTYSATLENGNALPTWLTFDATTRTFSGTPSNTDAGNLSVKVTVTDSGNLTATNSFTLSVINGVSGTPNNETLNGTAGDDFLDGGAGNDTLKGGAGNDVLDGGTGSDRLIGGTGDDIYIVDSSRDVVVERKGEGKDTVRSSASHTLTANVEDLILSGTANINGTGNKLDNVITGNSGNNLLKGLDGNDTLDGGAGNDILIGGKGNDILTGGEGVDIFLFGSGAKFNSKTFGVDTITDFTDGVDKLALSKTSFKVLTSAVGGQLQAAEFAVINAELADEVTTAGASSAKIVYNSLTGNLLYNQNGATTGLGNGGLFANLSGTPSVGVDDFLIQA